MMVNEEVELLKTLVLDLETELKTKGNNLDKDIANMLLMLNSNHLQLQFKRILV